MEDKEGRSRKVQETWAMVFLFCFEWHIAMVFDLSYANELCGTAKELVSAMVFLDLWSGFWQEKLRHYRDRRYPKPNFLLQQYTSVFVRYEEKRWGKKKQKNQVDINLWVNEGYGDCSTAVTWVAISESANVSFSEQPQLLLLFRSKHSADVKALYCG